LHWACLREAEATTKERDAKLIEANAFKHSATGKITVEALGRADENLAAVVLEAERKRDLVSKFQGCGEPRTFCVLECL
jgi:hypothetical protein